MRRFERRAFVIVTADDETHAAAMFDEIDGHAFDTHSDVPGYEANVYLDDGSMDELDEEDPEPAIPRLTLAPHLSVVGPGSDAA